MFSGILALLREAPAYNQVRDALLGRGRPPAAVGPGETAAAYVLAALATDPEVDCRHALVIAASPDAATRLTDDLRSLLAGTQFTMHLAAADATTRDRLAVLDALGADAPAIVVAPVAACIEPLPSAAALAASTREVEPGQRYPRERMVADLQATGYARVGLVANPGEFAVRGGLVDLYAPDAAMPVRIELWGDEIDSIRGLDPLSQRSLEVLPRVRIRPARLQVPLERAVPLSAHLRTRGLLVLIEPAETEAVARGLVDRAGRSDEAGALEWSEVVGAAPGVRRVAIAAARPPDGAWHEVRLAASGIEAHGGQTHLLAQMLGALAAEGLRVVIASAQAARLSNILRDAGVAIRLADRIETPPPAGGIVAVTMPLGRGFRLDGLAVVTDAEVVGWRRRRPRMRFLRDGERLSSWADLAPGDLVVHLHHGIGRYRGLTRLTMDGGEREYMLLEYAGEDRLYVPTDQIHLVHRYIGSEGETPVIHRLGGAEWDREKRRVKEATREMAASLLALYAARASVPGHAFAPDTTWQREMEALFPYQETPHQRQAIEDVKRDMESPKPMDRLVAGDVGYGKTEVALRAAFKAVMDGKQVAVVVPTTVLAQQHFNVFSERFAKFPVTVEMVSRFRSAAEVKDILNRVAAGQVDVLVGTHRILGKDVKFRDLGLVVIDEEQRFGVVHKEYLKQLRKTVDVLTLTATPIPRTLHMSLAGLRDMTVMETPPEARLPIQTEIRAESDELIREAILREHGRAGQTYIVHNRVESIERAARRIRALVPGVRVGVAHGQMPEERLEQVMLDFLGGRYDVLVCTTIVEIGLDIPSVNTIIIQDAHLMGLAQLYQLRGRVGRADRQAYCYLLYPPAVPLTPEAEQRLRAMAEFVELGSGLGLAMRDLEIRGAGNILGPEQHGHVAAVGFDLYCRLLDEAIREARGEIVEEPREPILELGVNALLPSAYIDDERDRMAYYRRLAAVRTADDLEAVAAELEEQYGPPPAEAVALLNAVRLRMAARASGVASITRQNGRFIVRFGEGTSLDESLQVQLRLALGNRAQVTPTGLVVRAADRSFAKQTAVLGEVLMLVGRVSARVAEATRG
ncbi:MAG: transcription-repair coupling factor [Armatimonadota bacterium]|nr:transcription-repair coupling factor [Armatimonadota bacterium]